MLVGARRRFRSIISRALKRERGMDYFIEMRFFDRDNLVTNTDSVIMIKWNLYNEIER